MCKRFFWYVLFSIQDWNLNIPLCTSVTHCQLTISLANSRYITWLIVVVYRYILYICAHKRPWNLKYIFDTWNWNVIQKLSCLCHTCKIFCQWNAVRIYFWWVDPEMSLSQLRNIFLCWNGLGIYFVKEMWKGYIFLVYSGVRAHWWAQQWCSLLVTPLGTVFRGHCALPNMVRNRGGCSLLVMMLGNDFRV